MRRWRVVFSNYDPVSGTLVSSGVDFVSAESPHQAAKAISRDGDAEKGITARVVLSVALDVRDPSPTRED